MKILTNNELKGLNKNALINTIKILQEENKSLKADYGNIAQVERDLLKKRIEEVIEYINSPEFFEFVFYTYSTTNQNRLKYFRLKEYLLEILQGNKEEE